VGKTFLAKIVGWKACKANQRVLFTTNEIQQSRDRTPILQLRLFAFDECKYRPWARRCVYFDTPIRPLCYVPAWTMGLVRIILEKAGSPISEGKATRTGLR
jgi:hypothetical protein